MKSKNQKNVVIADAVRYNRKEFKYLIPNEIIDIIIPELLSYMEPDKFSEKGFYPIYSVYFDTEDWQAYSAKMAGLQHRKKFRIRTYHDDPEKDEPVFLEVKEKFGNRIYKRRMPLNFNDAKDFTEKFKRLRIDNPIYDEWQREIARNRIKPKLLNYYLRRAFWSPNFPGLRITIDRDVSYTRTNDVNFRKPMSKVDWARGKSVLEIKYDNFLPMFVISIIRRYNLTTQPVSKYADSVLSSYLSNRE
jgi:hypothetical protein